MLAITDALSNLADVSRQLNEESDSVNELIASVEDAINSANPGVEVWLDQHRADVFAESVRDKAINEDAYGLDEPVRYDTFWIIGYGRDDDGSWRILARQDEEESTDDEARTQTLTRDYTWDETQVLGKEKEEQLMREAIVEDLIRIILIQLSAL